MTQRYVWGVAKQSTHPLTGPDYSGERAETKQRQNITPRQKVQTRAVLRKEKGAGMHYVPGAIRRRGGLRRGWSIDHVGRNPVRKQPTALDA